MLAGWFRKAAGARWEQPSTIRQGEVETLVVNENTVDSLRLADTGPAVDLLSGNQRYPANKILNLVDCFRPSET